jgi:hypothetical protein
MNKRDMAPLSGALFVLLAIVGLAILAGSTPDGDAPAKQIVSYYTDNSAREGAAAIVAGLSAVPLLLFAATVGEKMRVALPNRSVLPSFAFGAGVVAAAGLLGSIAIHLALADRAGDVQPTAAQAMNAIDGFYIVPFAVGLVTLILASSLAALGSSLLPSWLGWIGVALFAGAFTPAAFFAVLLSAPWIAAASILLYLRSRPATAQAPSGATASMPIAPTG